MNKMYLVKHPSWTSVTLFDVDLFRTKSLLQPLQNPVGAKVGPHNNQMAPKWYQKLCLGISLEAHWFVDVFCSPFASLLVPFWFQLAPFRITLKCFFYVFSCF